MSLKNLRCISFGRLFLMLVPILTWHLVYATRAVGRIVLLGIVIRATAANITVL